MINIVIRAFLSSVQIRFPIRMASSRFSYEDAVQKIYALPSNKSIIEQIKKDIQSHQIITTLMDMENYLMRVGLSLRKLDELSVIHVAGTKGKGSTSAICESILRHHGFSTGFYSSPHLVTFRERIRLNGKVISKEKFSKHFHHVYKLLEESKAYEHDMPKFFPFLTVLAFHIFLEEKVDVAILEVGLGGNLDYTNIVRKVPVVGITSLGLDHTSVLGNTLSEIAFAKAGIMKYGCEAYTVTQPPEAIAVLQRVANDVECPLKIVPDYKTYSYPNNIIYNPLQIELETYKLNASLAIQLAHAWMRIAKIQAITRSYYFKKVVSGQIIRPNDFNEIDSPYVNDSSKYLDDILSDEPFISALPTETVIGLRECKWPGRYHVIQDINSTFCLDGAHTKESIEICADWYKSKDSSFYKILIFYASGDRDVEMLLKPLSNIGFQTVFFVIPTANKINTKSDNYSVMERTEMLEKCHRCSQIWRGLCKNKSNDEVKVFECMSDALTSIKQIRNNMGHSLVLITGSLYLVGAALSILDPSLPRD